MDCEPSTKIFSPENLVYDGASKVVRDEAQHLLAWRGRLPQVGLALSGGGIRSATYCLGVLQALAYRRALPNIDYLSTVSGGGYIGASLSYLLHQSASNPALPTFDVSRENFPYVSYPMVGGRSRPAPHKAGHRPSVSDQQLLRNESFKGRLLRRLRQSSNYLVPGDGISFLSLAGVVVRNLAASVAVHVALLVLLFQCLFWLGVFSTQAIATPGDRLAPLAPPAEPMALPPANKVLFAAGAALLLFALLSALCVVLTRFFDQLDRRGSPLAYRSRRFYEVSSHWLLLITLALLVVGGLPWVYALLPQLGLDSFEGLLRLLGPQDKTKAVATGALAALVGAIGNVWGFLQARSLKKPLIPTGLVIGVASAALFFGLLLLVYAGTHSLNQGADVRSTIGVLVTAGAVLLFIGLVPEANYVSLHRFYRDRLLELFMPDLQRVHDHMVEDRPYLPLHIYLWQQLTGGIKALYTRVGGSRPGDATLLGDVCRAPQGVPHTGPIQTPSAGHSPPPAEPANKLLRGPYHLINAHVVLSASQHPRYRPRGGDNFIFSPLYCGSRATMWNPTDRSPGTGFTLATALAISGAAVNPNAGPGGEGPTRQPMLSVLMGLLSLRLGYWVANQNWVPALRGGRRSRPWVKPNLLYPGLFESFGRFNLNEYARYSLLTDGGHFENLGLYELVRRRLPLIVACDATADPDFKFDDLANAIQKVRADFGAIIDVSAEQLAALVPRTSGPAQTGGATGDTASAPGAGPATAERGYLIVPIRYARRVRAGAADPHSHGATALACGGEVEEEGDGEVGTLILLKATAFKGLPADLFSYRRRHPEFPNQATLDQFFDEKQFDAYRELGFATAHAMLKELEASGLGLGETYRTAKGYMAPTNHQVAKHLLGPQQRKPRRHLAARAGRRAASRARSVGRLGRPGLGTA